MSPSPPPPTLHRHRHQLSPLQLSEASINQYFNQKNCILNEKGFITDDLVISTKNFLCLNECPVLLERLSSALFGASCLLRLDASLALLLAVPLPEELLLVMSALALALPPGQPLDAGEASLQVLGAHKALAGLLEASKKLARTTQAFAKGRDCSLHARLPHARLPSCSSHILIVWRMTVVIRFPEPVA